MRFKFKQKCKLDDSRWSQSQVFPIHVTSCRCVPIQKVFTSCNKLQMFSHEWGNHSHYTVNAAKNFFVAIGHLYLDHIFAIKFNGLKSSNFLCNHTVNTFMMKECINYYGPVQHVLTSQIESSLCMIVDSDHRIPLSNSSSLCLMLCSILSVSATAFITSECLSLISWSLSNLWGNQTFIITYTCTQAPYQQGINNTSVTQACVTSKQCSRITCYTPKCSNFVHIIVLL